MGRVGGDSPLTEQGLKYAKALGDFFQKEHIPDMRVWCSQKVRAAQTAHALYSAKDYHVEYWKALDEIDAGICEGLTYSDIFERFANTFSSTKKCIDTPNRRRIEPLTSIITATHRGSRMRMSAHGWSPSLWNWRDR